MPDKDRPDAARPNIFGISRKPNHRFIFAPVSIIPSGAELSEKGVQPCFRLNIASPNKLIAASHDFKLSI
ncbi:MAG: hypothetical protein NTY50_08680 [Methylobacter sp.]|nr:hypothetical protein [Methylobacter sp.]